MNKLLVAIFDSEAAADAGQLVLRKLHAAGDISLYATGLLVRDAQGVTTVRKSLDASSGGAVTGLAVGSLLGLFGGAVGLAIGAVTGTVAGAVRDYWLAGVGLDFIEEAGRHLQPGKVALVADIEEEWIIPVDTALEAAGARIFRRTRTEVAAAQYEHDIAAFRAEIRELESEASHSGEAAAVRVQARLAIARSSLHGAVQRAGQRMETLKREAEARSEALQAQLQQARGDTKARIQRRLRRVNRGYHARGAKLARAWVLTKAALST